MYFSLVHVQHSSEDTKSGCNTNLSIFTKKNNGMLAFKPQWSEIRNRQRILRNTGMLKLNIVLLNNQKVKEEIRS